MKTFFQKLGKEKKPVKYPLVKSNDEVMTKIIKSLKDLKTLYGCGQLCNRCEYKKNCNTGKKILMIGAEK